MALHISSPRPSGLPRLIGAIVLLFAVLTALSIQRSASATVTPAFTPYSTTASGACVAAAVGFCTGAGEVIYKFDLEFPVPSNNVLWEIRFRAYAAGTGKINVAVADGNNPFIGEGIYIDLTATDTAKTLGPSTFSSMLPSGTMNSNWDPTIRVKKTSGLAVYFYDFEVIAHYEPLVQADLIPTIAGPGQVAAGQAFSYTVNLYNAGAGITNDAVLTTSLPAGLTVTSTQGCTNGSNAVPTCNVGYIAPFTSKSVTINLTTLLFITGAKTTTVTASSSAPDVSPGNNGDSIQTTVSGGLFALPTTVGVGGAATSTPPPAQATATPTKTPSPPAGASTPGAGATAPSGSSATPGAGATSPSGGGATPGAGSGTNPTPASTGTPATADAPPSSATPGAPSATPASDGGSSSVKPGGVPTPKPPATGSGTRSVSGDQRIALGVLSMAVLLAAMAFAKATRAGRRRS